MVLEFRLTWTGGFAHAWLTNNYKETNQYMEVWFRKVSLRWLVGCRLSVSHFHSLTTVTFLYGQIFGDTKYSYYRPFFIYIFIIFWNKISNFFILKKIVNRGATFVSLSCKVYIIFSFVRENLLDFIYKIIIFVKMLQNDLLLISLKY